MKLVMKNHIRMKEVSVLQHGPSYFYKDNQHEGPSKQNHSSNRNDSSRKNHHELTRGCLLYHKDLLLL